MPYITPSLAGVPGVGSPALRSYPSTQGAAFREGDFVVLTAAAAGKLPAPSGALAAAAGPAASAITLATAASSGAPAASYYVVVAYTATSAQSLQSAEYIVNCAAGTVPTVNVAAANAPSGATNYAVFAGVYEGTETLQQATTTTTALGTAFTLPNPLINPSGVNRAASNATANIAGLALHDSAAVNAQGVGGSTTAGGPMQMLGTWGNPPPLGTNLPAQPLVAALINGQAIEISLKQPWSAATQGSAAGITLDTSQQAAGVFIADTSATACLTIFERLDIAGSLGDTGARVRAIFNPSAVI